MSGEPPQVEWASGQLAEVSYSARAASPRALTRRAVRSKGQWCLLTVVEGLPVPDEMVRTVTPLYVVSLDAAIEAAAKAEFARFHALPQTWDTADGQLRDNYRSVVRRVVTAAVMGGAQ